MEYMDIAKFQELKPYEDRYYVSSAGIVYTLVASAEDSVLMEKLYQSCKGGYMRCTINGKYQFVHRIVAYCFLPLP